MATQELVPSPDYREVEQSRFLPVMSIQVAVQRRNLIVEAVTKLMKDGQDFGTLPGASKPALYQPGADKLNNLFGLVPRFVITDKQEDWTGEMHGGEAFFLYTTTCQLFRGDYLMGEGSGSCNSWESKYRYRKAERVCPSCGKDSIIKGKQEYGGGWLCFAKKGGCGAKFKPGDQSIEGQETGRVANPDIFDLVNTILKMANKRAKIAATLNATSANEFFTQDIEDIPQLQREAEQIDRGGHPVGTQAAADHVAQQKIRNARKNSEPPVYDVPPEDFSTTPPDEDEKLASQIKQRLDQFARIREALGDTEYYRVLGVYGFEHANEIKDVTKAREVYKDLRKAYDDAASVPR